MRWHTTRSKPLYSSAASDWYKRQVLKQLSAIHQVQKVWVEAGATLVASLIQLELVDELIVYLAPKLMGSDGRGLVHILGLNTMAEAIELDIKDVRMVGPDIRITAKILKNT